LLFFAFIFSFPCAYKLLLVNGHAPARQKIIMYWGLAECKWSKKWPWEVCVKTKTKMHTFDTVYEV